MLWLTSPAVAFGRLFDPALCAKVLGLERGDLLDISPQLLNAGNPTVYVALRNKSAVDRAWLDSSGLKLLRASEDEAMCVLVFTSTERGAYSRVFAPDYGVPEDPATGSSAGPLVAFMMSHGLCPTASGSRFVNEQGTKMGRRGLLHVHVRGESGAEGIEVGGHVAPVAVAQMRLGS
jgi:trans-2,3-dihydro-3-hydroxyanthranilate isomerase